MEILNIFFYIILFAMGITFGSFYTLALYRIPKRQDITHTHSYCPNCNHKLGFLDLIPVFSYIFLGAKCRYCKQKIRPRYLILETLSGLLFIIIAYFMGLKLENLNSINIINFCFVVLYLTYIILMAGIDKENRKIDKAVNIYGIAISIMYMSYLCIVGETNIYRYGIYLILYIVILLVDTITLKKFAKSTYLNGILLLILIMASFTGEFITSISLVTALLGIGIYILIYKIKQDLKRKKSDKQISDEISIGFWLGASNILIFLITLIYNYNYYII